MYSTSSISKRLILVPILVVVVTQLLLMPNVSSLNITNAYLHHKCLTNEGKYKPGSEHEKELNNIIHSFLNNSGNQFRDGFSSFSYKNISVTFQCRGDSYGPKCRSCYATAQSELRKRCPRYKGSLIWYDQCHIEFSSKGIFRNYDFDDSKGFCISSKKNLSNNIEMLHMLDNLTNIMSTNKSVDSYVGGSYVAGERRFEKETWYIMAQCISGLVSYDCAACLSYTMSHFKNCYENKQGARVFMGMICNFRFEIYPFVNPKTSPNYYKF